MKEILILIAVILGLFLMNTIIMLVVTKISQKIRLKNSFSFCGYPTKIISPDKIEEKEKKN